MSTNNGEAECSHCGYPDVRWYEGYWQCDGCGAEWPDQLDPIEERVAELFAARFPPGSDGPPAEFDIGALYEQAESDLREGGER